MMLATMSEVPPPYASYPRNTASYGSAAQLQSLYEAYSKYSWLFAANIVISLVIFGGLGATRNGTAVLAGYVIVPLILGALSYPLNKKLGYGASWSSGQVILATVLMGLNSVCCGIVGFVVVQQIAANHMKPYGLKSGFLGIKRRDVQAKLAEMQGGAPLRP